MRGKLEIDFENASNENTKLELLKTIEEALVQREESVGRLEVGGNGELQISTESKSSDIADEFYHSVSTAFLVRIVKRYTETNEEIAESASRLLANMCGEGTRGSIQSKFVFEQFSFNFELPSFASADVGCRAWGAAKLLCSWMVHGEVFASLAQEFRSPRIVELGCGAFPLCGVVAAHVSAASELTLTDINEPCLKSAAENAENCRSSVCLPEKLTTRYFDWADSVDVPEADIVIGAAVVYEPIHAEILPKALVNCLANTNGKGYAVVALHEEQTGFFRFHEKCSELGLSILQQIGPVYITEVGPNLLTNSQAYIFVLHQGVPIDAVKDPTEN